MGRSLLKRGRGGTEVRQVCLARAWARHGMDADALVPGLGVEGVHHCSRDEALGLDPGLSSPCRCVAEVGRQCTALELSPVDGVIICLVECVAVRAPESAVKQGDGVMVKPLESLFGGILLHRHDLHDRCRCERRSPLAVAVARNDLAKWRGEFGIQVEAMTRPVVAQEMEKKAGLAVLLRPRGRGVRPRAAVPLAAVVPS